MINKKRHYPKVNKLFLILCDFFSLCIAIFLAYYLSFPDDFSLSVEEFYDSVVRLSLFLFSALGIVGWIWVVYRHYTYRKPYWDELKDIYVTLFIGALINLALLVFTKNHFSLYTWCYIWVLAGVLLPLGRMLCKKALRELGTWNMSCALVCDAQSLKGAFQAITSETYLGYNITAIVLQGEEKESPEQISGVKYITPPEFWVQLNQFQKVFIAFDNQHQPLLECWVRKLAKEGLRNVSILPPLRGVPLYDAEVSHFFGHEAIALRIHNNLAKRSSRLVKRTFDIVVSSFLLLLTAPLFGYLVLRIRQDGGAATYSQVRIGRNGKAFHCYKFRTMVTNSAQVLRQLLHSDPQARQEWYTHYKLKNDPRVTPIGALLRRTSLDELPQLWNVLKGDMSLVGPRPVIRPELKFYGDDLIYYYMVRPGLSGLWQVSGRSDTDYPTRVYLDCWYVKNWALWNDIVILAKTASVVLKGKGAY
ncbi:undecaprenyl-phosphate galactose phosphotransferase WbaP [Pasteurellaceae bacterium 20609_3]|uniref:undecaprenyl-phosphate galactose phosphotransferase WbaP n=1 Tax=Spirabiliibacterium mucosae TaxID=28156 RepID=UPI001AAD5545|nr:undecaprenyl-phosphate galactose phosphotransferase WbaP [Spirabiliibacterium mucosae]MBE2899082.1 undecaprenyl-phosphate galactose phosphotransferase WbaP [Spirabiliibacterium mucosae]